MTSRPHSVGSSIRSSPHGAYSSSSKPRQEITPGCLQVAVRWQQGHRRQPGRAHQEPVTTRSLSLCTHPQPERTPTQLRHQACCGQENFKTRHIQIPILVYFLFWITTSAALPSCSVRSDCENFLVRKHPMVGAQMRTKKAVDMMAHMYSGAIATGLSKRKGRGKTRSSTACFFPVTEWYRYSNAVLQKRMHISASRAF